nr:Ycf46 [Erythrotrichia welwitschii]
MTINFIKEIEILLKSHQPIIYVTTQEESRFEYMFKELVNSCYSSYSLVYWDFIVGFEGNPNFNGKALKNPLKTLEIIEDVSSEGPSFFILKDFNIFLNDNSINRKMRNLYKNLSYTGKTIVIVASELKIPSNLNDFITIVTFPLPNVFEIRSEIERLSCVFAKPVDTFVLDRLSTLCQGLSFECIRKILFKCFILSESPSFNVYDFVLYEKKQIIRQTQILEFCDPEVNIDDIGGLDNLKSWLTLRSSSFSEEALLYGLPSPKGLLLVGIQGTGKSLVSKAIASEWQLPLLRLDVGNLFAGIVGESEAKVRKMIQIADSLSPCVLWIDEIDKAFRGLNSGSDGGTSNRVFATFITWLSEKKTRVFVVSTANDIYSLPSELLRKGRFDEIFFLSLPSFHERVSIFNVHLKKLRPRTWDQYDVVALSHLANDFSGAEIYQTIVEAMYKAFSEKRDFLTTDIISAIKETVPLAHTHSDALQSIQNWASAGKIRPASIV